MKTKNFNKKLTLKKETIASLGNSEMKHVRGGAYTGNSCATDYPICTAPRCCEHTFLCKTITC